MMDQLYQVRPLFRNERAFTDSIKRAARTFGWKCYHTFDSRRSSPGYPDLTLVRNGRLIFAELKMPRGRLSDYQRGWINELQEAGQEIHVWKPENWDEILDILQGDEDAPRDCPH